MLMTDKQVRIQLKRDTAENWKRENIALLEGEIGYETDTGKYKIGRMINGELASWSELDYSNEDFNLYLERLEQYGDGNIEPTSDEYFSFELNEDKKSYTILAKEELNSAKIETLTIPYEYNGLPVTIIKGETGPETLQFCYHNDYVEKVYMPNTIISLYGSYSFSYCHKLSHIKLSNQLVNLGDPTNIAATANIFSNNPLLKEIRLPNTLEYINPYCMEYPFIPIIYIPRNHGIIQSWIDYIKGLSEDLCHYAYYDDLVLTASDDETKKFKIQIDSSGKLTATALFSESAAAATTTEEMEVN